ncbi:hypothetical protein RRG08_021119 [Elysia crispata]|uniref:Calponin-homology (CH) domain-containing protein n=1 Tax=Elysia crispata TaxID=231223 RepID=A0AAE0Z6S2_9GAST|nr:hypothetical protein RRG08_021119 [Elysia crispata]
MRMSYFSSQEDKAQKMSDDVKCNLSGVYCLLEPNTGMRTRACFLSELDSSSNGFHIKLGKKQSNVLKKWDDGWNWEEDGHVAPAYQALSGYTDPSAVAGTLMLTRVLGPFRVLGIESREESNSYTPTGEKVKDIKPKPKNSAQMVENINTSLTFLAALGVSVDGVSAKDIKDGNLKSILGLFFSLSRYKQQQKTLLQQQKQQQLKQQQHQRGQGSSATTSSGADNNSNVGNKAIANGGETISSHIGLELSQQGHLKQDSISL